MALYKRVPVQILIAAYHKKDGADKALEHLVEAMKDEQIVCTNVAVAKMDKKGRVRVKELGKPGFVKGLVGGGAHGQAAGAAIGGAALSLLGPIGVAVGGVTGGLVGRTLESVQGAVIGSVGKVTVDGMEKDKLKDLGSSLLPETSALVAVFSEVVVSKHKFNDELKLEKGGVDLLVEIIDTEITKKLKDHLDVAYHIVVLEGGCVMSQATQACSTADFRQVIITPDATTLKEVTEAPDGMAAGVAAVLSSNGEVMEEDVVAAKGDAEEALLSKDVGVTVAESFSGEFCTPETEIFYARLSKSFLKKEEAVYTGEGVAGAVASSISGDAFFYMAEDENYELTA